MGKEWRALSKLIQRSVDTITHLIETLELHLSDGLLCNQISEKTLQSSRFIVINDLCNRIRNLAIELKGCISQYYCEHFSDLERTIKWINDEYSAINHYNSSKDAQFSSIKRVQALYNSLRMCSIIKSNYNSVLNFTYAIENKIDHFTYHKLSSTNLNTSSSETSTSTLLEQISNIGKFTCYNSEPEIFSISNYLEN
ncbi:hypothetical protein HWI79_3273 [Cryptosporidium felis]|nr:hypothetical protein HWI79_3273 [Cryptosporidium felis]